MCSYDVIIIGGGFYGVTIGTFLRQNRYADGVLLVEQENRLMTRASYNNQARIHNGYHYPRSLTTALRSRVNFSRFVQNWRDSVWDNFTKVYAIARRDSRVDARYFERFCKFIGAKVQKASQSVRDLFNKELIEDVFLVEEFAFDANKLAEQAEQMLRDSGVEVLLNARVEYVSKADKGIEVGIRRKSGIYETVYSRYVFNCTYSAVNHIESKYQLLETKLKHEITEIGLIQPPPEIANIGITVMDGPFFSTIPFPPKNCYSITHVRYTPHVSWEDDISIDPYQKLNQYDKQTKVDRMLRDAARYLPCLAQSTYIGSLFEVKTVLLKNEADDGRPILFEECRNLPHFYSILGGKIDNIYDILEKIEKELIVDGKIAE